MVSRFGSFRNAFLSESRIKTASTENTDKEESEEARERGSGEGERTGKRENDAFSPRGTICAICLNQDSQD